jgi:hypothetical protein
MYVSQLLARRCLGWAEANVAAGFVIFYCEFHHTLRMFVRSYCSGIVTPIVHVSPCHIFNLACPKTLYPSTQTFCIASNYRVSC